MPGNNHAALPPGCFLLKYKPKNEIDQGVHFDGVLRHTPDNPRIKASADLYEHRPPAVGADEFPEYCKKDQLKPDGMPVFPPETYRFYLEVRELLDHTPDAGSVSLRFRVHRFDAQTKRFTAWGERTAILKGNEDKSSLVGSVLDAETGEPVGTLVLKLISEHFVRKAKVKIDTDDNIPLPLDNGVKQHDSKDYHDWTKVFRECKWDLQTEPSKHDPTINPNNEALKKTWTDEELHRKMTGLPKSEAKPDGEWKYHLLCVGRFANTQYQRGVMYDIGGGDLNQEPREGAAIAAGWSLADSKWKERWEGLKDSDYFYQAKGLYFRTAAHEIAHAMGLEHNHETRQLMNTTDALEEQSRTELQAAFEELATSSAQLERFRETMTNVDEPQRRTLRQLIQARNDEALERLKEASFPGNIKWTFSDREKDHLQHAPDVMVRPGTFVEGSIAGFGDARLKWAEGLELRLKPLLASVPRGAPVRVRLTLRNVSDRDLQVPLTLHLKSGHVDGTVTGPGGEPVRPFYPLLRGMDSDRLHTLHPGEELHHWMTLLRGHEGALFTRAGDHTIKVRVSWHLPGSSVYLDNETHVQVEAGADALHQLAALSLLDSPSAFLGLVTGSVDPVVEACMKVAGLKPHYALLRIKEWLNRSEGPALDGVRQLLSEEFVASFSELNAVERILSDLHRAGKISEEDREKLAGLVDKKRAELQAVTG